MLQPKLKSVKVSFPRFLIALYLPFSRFLSLLLGHWGPEPESEPQAPGCDLSPSSQKPLTTMDTSVTLATSAINVPAQKCLAKV